MLRKPIIKTAKAVRARMGRTARQAMKSLLGENVFRVCGFPAGTESLECVDRKIVYTPETFDNPPPETIEPRIHEKFFPQRKFPEAFVATLQDGISTDRGYNLTRKARLVPKLSYEAYLLFYYPDWNTGYDPKEFPILMNREYFPKIERFEGSVATLSTLHSKNYYHWLFDVLPRLHLLEKAGVKVDRLYVENLLPFQRRTLELLGLGGDRVIDSSTVKYIQAQELVVPSVPGIPGTVPRWVCDYLRDTFVPKTHAIKSGIMAGERLYVTRSKPARRRIENEEELLPVLERHGFRTVDLEGLNFLDQVSLFANAECVLGPHGANLANITFCRAGTRVLEILSARYVNPCYWKLSLAAGCRYHYLMGDPIGNERSEWAGNENMIVNVSKLTRAIEKVLAT
ncbi:MAG: glycosyltransferase family 61 protein [Verrucomicrobiota bacterium]